MTKRFQLLILKLSKIKILLTFLIILLSLPLKAENNKKPCFKNTSFNLNELEIPYKISVKVNKNKTFQTNNLKIITSTGLIKKKFKKRFSGKVKIFYNDKICDFKATIRVHGDFKDHVKLIKGNINQSLDIHLKEGNINGITKFKLFLPETRNNPGEEILITEIFRSLNVLAPRTFFINVDNQSNNYLALFQEKTEKEFLEFNNRKESVILEGDERFIFDVEDESFGWKSKLISLARISNDNLFDKSSNYKDILFYSLSNLNKFYLDTKDYYQNYGLYDYDVSKVNNYDFDRSIFFKQKIKFSIFNSLIFATNAQHALAPHNRKFYWNKEYQIFEPIYYDGNIDINKELNTISFPKKVIFFDDIKKTLDLVNNLDSELLSKKIRKNFNVVDKDINQIVLKIDKIKSNLSKILDLDISKITNEPINLLNHEKNIQHYFKRVDKDKIAPVFINKELNNFYKCTSKSCDLINLDEDELKLLINGNLKRNNNFYQFIGIKEIKNKKIVKKEIQFVPNYEILDYQNSKIIYDKKEYFIKELKPDLIEIKQLLPNSRIMIVGGSLTDLKILAKFIPQSKNSNEKSFGIRGLTGCLNLIDMNLKNLDIEIKDGNCEDGLNIIRSRGSINKLIAINSANDALDIDFSNLKISKINISSAGNDCIDLSFGKYQIGEIDINDCGDKAISVGEKSELNINKLNAFNSKIGIASKDGSKTKLKSGYFEYLDTCLSAYNKKQEFTGGFIEINNFNCLNSTNKLSVDEMSTINLNG